MDIMALLMARKNIRIGVKTLLMAKKISSGVPVEFHLLEDGNLIIVGAYSANSLPDGLYLDCAPDWIYPEQNGNVLTIEQVYSAVQNGNVLEVE